MAKATRSMTKSPRALAQMAMSAAKQGLPAYSGKFSKRKFTQHQVFALLVLKAFFKTDYRGIVSLVTDWKDLQKELGLLEVPHFSTLWHAERRLLKKGLLTYCNESYSEKLGSKAFYAVHPGRSSTLQA